MSAAPAYADVSTCQCVFVLAWVFLTKQCFGGSCFSHLTYYHTTVILLCLLRFLFTREGGNPFAYLFLTCPDIFKELPDFNRSHEMTTYIHVGRLLYDATC